MRRDAGWLALAIAACLPLQALAQEIRVGGSGGATIALQAVVEAFQKRHPETRWVAISGLGTRGGIRAAANGSLDLAAASRPLRGEEISMGLSQTEFARTPFVFAVHEAARSTGITFTQLASIYAGKTTAWPDGTRLRVVLRPPGDSDTLVLRALSPELERASLESEASPGMVIAMTDLESTESIERIPGAIGTTTLSQIVNERRALKPLKLQGVEPSIENARSGAYPAHKRFFLVVRQPVRPPVQKFMDFIRSSTGREILERSGHWVPQAG